MWIFTQSGFVSIVSERSRAPFLTVRSRDKKSISSLLGAIPVEISETPMADYPFRVYVTKEQLVPRIEEAISSLDYPNFKDRVAIKRGRKYSEALHAVWSAMLAVEERPTFRDR